MHSKNYTLCNGVFPEACTAKIQIDYNLCVSLAAHVTKDRICVKNLYYCYLGNIERLIVGDGRCIAYIYPGMSRRVYLCPTSWMALLLTIVFLGRFKDVSINILSDLCICTCQKVYIPILWYTFTQRYIHSVI